MCTCSQKHLFDMQEKELLVCIRLFRIGKDDEKIITIVECYFLFFV